MTKPNNPKSKETGSKLYTLRADYLCSLQNKGDVLEVTQLQLITGQRSASIWWLMSWWKNRPGILFSKSLLRQWDNWMPTRNAYILRVFSLSNICPHASNWKADAQAIIALHWERKELIIHWLKFRMRRSQEFYTQSRFSRMDQGLSAVRNSTKNYP